ncbi:hypothetical protein [Gulosibacter sp. 10]|uniref:hypothetical protein n=1 Tax=Gulosibacter sp. 10 TaxID=1255570 RepID=UPI00097F4286|nr:hypothetical protein [Gulosibacter sp. 10]SJM70841.1 putative DNA-binding protein [Gulosibacter sp. 10]
MTAHEDPAVHANRRAQCELYGDTLEARLGAVRRAYGIPQRRLAQVLGVSAPMLSQLISARRVKMGNPLAYERMVELERRAGELARTDVETILGEVAAADITTTTQQRIRTGTAAPAVSGDEAAEMLSRGVDAEELRSAGDVLRASGAAPALLALIEAALGKGRNA